MVESVLDVVVEEYGSEWGLEDVLQFLRGFTGHAKGLQAVALRAACDLVQGVVDEG